MVSLVNLEIQGVMSTDHHRAADVREELLVLTA
jgi:hypothetical protein